MGARVWVADDLIAVANDQPVPPRAPLELQAQLLDMGQVATLRGLEYWQLDSALARARRAYHLLPKPDGMAAGRRYWLISNYQRWLANRPIPPTRRGPSGAGYQKVSKEKDLRRPRESAG
jgi:hypothetical protein